jgi:hypothetical protein
VESTGVHVDYVGEGKVLVMAHDSSDDKIQVMCDDEHPQ